VRIAIDASRCTVRRVTGTEHYAIELIRSIIRQNTQHTITLYFRESPANDLFPTSDHVQYRIIPFRRAWTHLRFAAALWRDRPDVTFVPAHTLPFLFPGRAVVTVHDLGFKHFPQAHPAGGRRYLDWTTRYSAWHANLIFADSQATADDLTRFYGTVREKIRVVYPGVNHPIPLPISEHTQSSGESFKPSPTEAVRQKYGLPERYFLFIGTLQPRKNIIRIVKAYQKWRDDHPNDPAGLVLAGGKGWLYDPSWAESIQGVYLPGYIDDADKNALYAGAIGLVFPTLYEGFGFPVIEAMNCGTPVIASNTSSLPELVGQAGLLVDPLDVEAIAAAMGKLSDDETLRDILQERGYGQAATFTWESAGKQALAGLEAVAREDESINNI
jgi:glycosyltransferase involved in cell wall biosynthesis